MLNEESFWKLINKNKSDPEQFLNEDLSLEDIFEFYDYFSDLRNELSEHNDFIMDIAIDYDLTNYVEKGDRIIFGSAFDDIEKNIIFGGQDLYNAFMSEDESLIVDYLDKYSEKVFKNQSLTESLIWHKYITKVCNTKEELDLALEDKYDEYLDRFHDEMEEYYKNKIGIINNKNKKEEI